MYDGQFASSVALSITRLAINAFALYTQTSVTIVISWLYPYATPAVAITIPFSSLVNSTSLLATRTWLTSPFTFIPSANFPSFASARLKR